MKQSIDLRQSQKLAMTPQLQQAIKLLQMSTAELNEELQQAHEINPLLEITDETPQEFDSEQNSIEPAPVGQTDVGGSEQLYFEKLADLCARLQDAIELHERFLIGLTAGEITA